MSYNATVYRILIASPSDVIHERKAIPEVIHHWNAINSIEQNVILEPVLWETHSAPKLGDRPQEILNRQLVDNCDLLIGVFWTRLGTPTGVADSGTVEEIETFRKAGKPVMLYFCTKPVVPDSIELDEYARLKDFKAQCVKEGLIEKYDDVGELREKLQRQITTTVRELRGTNLPISNVQGDEQISDNEITVQQNALKTFRSNFETFLREFEADWIAERDSEPYNIEDGQYILDHACSEVIHFKSQIVNDSDGRLSEVLIDTAKQLKSLKRHHVYADGGRSFRDFWKKGDEVIEKLKGVPTIVDNVLANADTGN